MHIDINMTHRELEIEMIRLAAAKSRELRCEKLNLYAGASLLSKRQCEMISPDLSAMPSMGPLNDKEQPSSELVAGLEKTLSDLAQQVFHADWADCRLPSCTVANLAVFSCFGGAGATMLGPAGADGGHLSQRRGGTPSVVGMQVYDLPFDAYLQQLDNGTTAELITASQPTLVMLGRSVILEPEKLTPVVEAAHRVGAITIYDASHVAGLIAGGRFPNPLDSGVDILTMSTYKTLGGPTGGMVVGRSREQGEAFSHFLNETMLANQNASRYPALVSALHTFHAGSDYAHDVINAAQHLKSALDKQGLDVLLPQRPAGSHQVVVRTGNLGETIAIMNSLEASGILVGRCPIPGRLGEFGLRFGSQVAASIGLIEKDMDEVATLITRVVQAYRDLGEPLDIEHPCARITAEQIAEILKAAERKSGKK